MEHPGTPADASVPAAPDADYQDLVLRHGMLGLMLKQIIATLAWATFMLTAGSCLPSRKRGGGRSDEAARV
jgi:hypothetical protein